MTDQQIDNTAQHKLFHDWVKTFPYNSYLYGSRRMIDRDLLPKTTDWDVAVQDSVFVETYLIEDGWVILATDEYTDTQTTRVYEKRFSGIYVQIALRRDLELFRDCWNQIKTDFYETFLHKASPSYIGKDNVTQYLQTLYNSYERGFYYKDAFRQRTLNIRPKSAGTKGVGVKNNIHNYTQTGPVPLGWVNVHIDHIQPMDEPVEELVPVGLEWWEPAEAMMIPPAHPIAAQVVQGQAF